MRITPLDIRQAEFRTKMRGYDPLEVQNMLQMAAAELEGLIRENQNLRQELHTTVAKLSEMREKETLLRETLMEAQRTRQSVQESSRKEADLILAEADMRARELLNTTHRELNELRREIQALRNEKVRARNEIKASLKTFQTWVESDEQADRDKEPAEQRLHFFEPPTSATGS